MRTRDVMSALPAHIGREAELPDAAQRLRSLKVRHLPVVDASGVLVGMVFDHDVFSRGGYLGDLWVWFEDDESSLRIADIAHPVDVPIDADDDLTVVLRRIAASAQDCAVAIDADRHPVGIVTEHDALRVAARVLPESVLADHESAHAVQTVNERTPGPEVWAAMRRAKGRHLPVVDDNGRLTGIISMRDLIEDDAAHRAELHAEGIVRGPVKSAPPTTPLRHLAARMVEHRIGCMPLVNEMGHPMGLVTRRDVLGAAVAALEDDALFP